MKTKILLFFSYILIIFSNIIAQGINIGGGLSFPSGGIGLNALMEYQINSKVTIRSSYNFDILQTNACSLPNTDYSCLLTNFSFNILYRITGQQVQPYGGVGLGYFTPDISQNGNADFLNSQMLNKVKYNNSTGYIFLIGVDFTAQYALHFVVEYNYTLLKPDCTYYLEDFNLPFVNIKHNGTADLSFSAVKCSFIFEL